MPLNSRQFPEIENRETLVLNFVSSLGRLFFLPLGPFSLSSNSSLLVHVGKVQTLKKYFNRRGIILMKAQFLRTKKLDN